MKQKQRTPAKPKRSRQRLLRMVLPGIFLILVGIILSVKAYRATVTPTAGSAVSVKTAEEVAAATPNVFLDAVTNSLQENAPAAEVLPEVQFDQHLTAGRPIVAFFHSNNCVQCVKMIEVVEQVYPDFAGSVALVDVNVYDRQNKNLLRRADIRAIPTIIFIDGARQGQSFIGLMETEVFRDELQRLAEE